MTAKAFARGALALLALEALIGLSALTFLCCDDHDRVVTRCPPDRAWVVSADTSWSCTFNAPGPNLSQVEREGTLVVPVERGEHDAPVCAVCFITGAPAILRLTLEPEGRNSFEIVPGIRIQECAEMDCE